MKKKEKPKLFYYQWIKETDIAIRNRVSRPTSLRNVVTKSRSKRRVQVFPARMGEEGLPSINEDLIGTIHKKRKNNISKRTKFKRASRFFIDP